MRKTIVTFAGPNMRPFLDAFSLPSFKRFADRHNYMLQVTYPERDDADRRTSFAKEVRWGKLSLIRSALEQNDVVLWLDADVLLCRFDTDIIDSLGNDDFQGLVLHSVPFENRISPNTGVWVIRNTDKAFKFLDRVSDVGIPEGRWADQGAVLRVLEWELGDDHYHGAKMPDIPTEFMFGTAWLPIGWNQTYSENRDNPAEYTGRLEVPNPFAIHFSRMSIHDRMKYMREVADRYSHELQSEDIS